MPMHCWIYEKLLEHTIRNEATTMQECLIDFEQHMVVSLELVASSGSLKSDLPPHSTTHRQTQTKSVYIIIDV